MSLLRTSKASFALIVFLMMPYCVGTSAADSPLKVGFVSDLTGIGSFFGLPSQRGAILAAEQFSTLDRKVELIFEDIAGKIPAAISAAQKLLYQDKVDAIICDLTPPCAAIAPLVQGAGKILIYHSPATSIREKNSLAFRNFIDYTDACQSLGRYLIQETPLLGGVNAFIEFGERCHEGILRVAPDYFSYRYNPGDDLRSVATTFKAKGINRVIFTGYDHDFLNWIKFSRQQGHSLHPAFIELLLTESFWKLIGHTKFEGTVAGWQDPPPEFTANFRAKFGIDESTNIQAAALSYNAVRALTEVFRACPMQEKSCLLSEMHKPRTGWHLNFQGWTGQKPEYPVILKRIKDGRIQPILQNTAE